MDAIEIKMVARPWETQDLIDDLQDIIDEESDNYLNTRRITLLMARDYLKEYFAESKWIPVTERLPERDVLVLCVGAKGGMFIGNPRCVYGNEVTAYTYVPNARGGRNTKYWMPLPEPPKGE